MSKFVVTDLLLIEDSDVDQVKCKNVTNDDDLFVLDVYSNMIELDKGDQICLEFAPNVDLVCKQNWDYITKGYIWGQKKFKNYTTWQISFGGLQMIYSNVNDKILCLDTNVYLLLKKV